jgi:hypothetical protein
MYLKYENKSRNESRFLVRLRHKTCGVKSRIQCIEIDRKQETDRDIRAAFYSVTQFLKDSETYETRPGIGRT